MKFSALAAGMFLLGTLMSSSIAISQETPHLIGIHDDDFPSVNEWISRGPGGTAWITATEALGHDPTNMSGKTYQAPAGSTIIARLNNGYNPDGTLPLKEHYADFAQRCANFVANSSGCDIWLIANETNLGVEWPRRNGVPEAITPEDYAEAFKLAYNAIKAVRPDHKVLVQSIAPWAGPYSFPGEVQPDNWVDYQWKMMRAITSGPDAVMPDGITLHINSRTYDVSSVSFGQRITAGGLPLEFSWGVHRDWIQWGIPRELWHLPLYATESNGRTYWSGIDWPEPGMPAYQTGWLQAVYTSVNDWNQAAAQFGMPIYRCVNMYRWCNCDGHTINAAPNKAQILADVEASAALGFTWPQYGGNALTIATPTGTKITEGIAATASSFNGTGFEPANAFDGSTSTRWESGGTAGQTFTHWLVADLGEMRPISGYVVRHASSGGLSADRNTLAFLIETSNTSPTGPWTTNTVVRTSEPGQNGPASTALKYDEPHLARYVRLFINGSGRVTGSQARARVQELEIYLEEGAPTPTPTPEPTATPEPTPTPPPPVGEIIVEGQTVALAGQLNPAPDNADDLQGVIATRLRGGFHPIVTNPADMEAAFTDGVGMAGIAGLLRDYPPDGFEQDHTDQPSWSGFWILDGGQPVNLDEVRIYSGNAGKDGRVWHNADLYVTTDPSPSANSTWQLVKEEIKPAIFGTPNPGTIEATGTRTYREGDAALWNSVTAMRLDLFSTAAFGVNNFANSTAQTMIAPIVFEVDAYTSEATPPTPTPTPTPEPTATPEPTPSGTPLPTPTPTPTPIPYSGVTNGNFETFSGSGTNIVADGWTTWKTAASGAIRWGRAVNNRYEGASSQYWDSPTGQRHDGGVYQVIDVTPGAHYRITAKMKRWLSGTATQIAFGYDLTGGTIGDAPTVQYTDLKAVRHNHWAEYEAVVTAAGPQITLFARGGIAASGSPSYQTYLDYVRVEQYPTANLPTPTPVTNKLTRPGFKGISLPYYYPWTGNLLTEYVANDAAELGVEMTRVEFVTEANGSINFAAYDELVDRAASRGIEVLGLIDYSAVPVAISAEWESQTFRDAFAARCAELVSHFHNRTNPIKHWEIWNEQDLDVSNVGGPDWRIEPVYYARLIIQAFDTIKAIDPTAVVVFGGVSPKGFEYTQNYLRDVYQSQPIIDYRTANGRYPWDVMAVHPYPEIFTSPIPGLANVMNERVKAVMNDFGEEDTPVWITELGWSSSAVGQNSQAIHMTDAFLLLDKLVDYENPAKGPYVDRFIWFNYQDFGPVDKWGVVDENFNRKPTFQAYIDLGRAAATAPPGTNLAFNGSFEQGFTGTIPSPAVGTGWTSWTTDWSGAVTFAREEDERIDGLYAQSWSSTAPFSGGIWQRVEVVPGEGYVIRAWMRREDSAPDAWMEFGLDATGGTDPEGANVQYTKLEGHGEDLWVLYEQEVIATGNHVTLFAKGGHATGTGEANRFYVDGIFLGKPAIVPLTETDTWRISRLSPVLRSGVAGLH
jgi:hypothetical protein